MKQIINNIKDALHNRTEKHYLMLYGCLVFAAICMIIGVTTKTPHNCIIGILAAIYGRIYLNVDCK